MKIYILTLLLPLLTLAFQVRADDIDVIPMTPIDCKQKEVKDVSAVHATTAIAGDLSSLTLQLTYGTCSNGKKNLEQIRADYGLYMIDREYSSDFKYDYSASGDTVTVQISLQPAVFFAEYPARHFDLDFYPSSSAPSFGFNLTFTKDAVTGRMSALVTPR